MQQVEIVSLENLVPLSHDYRKYIKTWKFKSASRRLKKLEKLNPYKGYGMLRLFKCLLLQFVGTCLIESWNGFCKKILQPSGFVVST